MEEVKENTTDTEISLGFIYSESQYCETLQTTQGNLQIQCNPYQIPMSLFTEIEKKKHLSPHGTKKDFR
jgi:hypothetical protein